MHHKVAYPLFSYVIGQYLYLIELHKKIVILKAVKDLLKDESLSTLYEVRDLLSDMISMREALPDRISPSDAQGSNREVIEERHSGAMTFRLERVSCGKNCKGCPHGPYWYGYWREGGKTRSKYIGKKLTANRQKRE